MNVFQSDYKIELDDGLHQKLFAGRWHGHAASAFTKGFVQKHCGSAAPAITQIQVMAGEKRQSDFPVKRDFSIPGPCERKEQQAVVGILPPSARIPAGGRVGVVRAESAVQFDACGSGINPNPAPSKQQENEI